MSLTFYNPITKKDEPVVDTVLAAEALRLLQGLASAPVFPIDTEDGCERAKEFNRRASHVASALTDSRKAIGEPFLTATRAINAGAGTLIDPLVQTVQSVKNGLLSYAKRVELARAVQEQARLEAELFAESRDREGRLTAPLVIDQPMPMPAANVPTRTDKVLRVLNPSRIPAKYFTLNESLLKADILAGNFNDPQAAYIEDVKKVVVR